jgi:hypothetical protein
MVEFVIGKDGKRFSIHAALAKSFPEKLLESPLNSEIDEAVFGHCCEFVYSGDYSVFEDSEYMENMQDILRDYAAWNVEILMQNADFQRLLNRVPPLEKAIFRSMWE